QATKARLEGDLEETKRAYEVGRGKAQVLANKLASFSTELLDVVVVADARPSRLHPSKPPPIPTARPSRTFPAAAPGEAQVVEAIPVVAIEPVTARLPSITRSVVLVLGGLVVGVGLSFAVVKLTEDATPAVN